MNKNKLATSKEGVLQGVGCIKSVILVLVLCTTVLVFSLSIVFYYLTSYSVINNHQATVNILPNTSYAVNNSMPCDSSTILSWGVIEDSVTECEPYTGTICLPYLIQWNQCILPGGGDQEEIHVAVNSNGKTQDILEEELLQLNALLENLPECQPVAIPFLCHHYFPLMAAECQSTAVDDDQTLYTVTQEDCINIRDTICAAPWQLADTLGYADRLPNCQSLPNTNVSVELMNMTMSLIPVSNQSVSCRDDFISINNTCYPHCDRFEGQSHDFTRAIIIAEVLSATVGALLSATALILSIYNRKRMLKFPFYFLLLFITNSFVGSVSILIFGIKKTKLLCSSLNLLEAIDKPTIYCYISATLVHYSIINLVIWWFFHLCIFFYEMMFPFHAHRMRELGRTKKLSILLLMAGFLIPIPGVIVGLTSGKNQYNFNRFPPSLCTPSGDVLFYSSALPITVLMCIGTCLLIIILWKINRHYSNKAKKSGTRQSRLTVAEKKLVIVSVLVIIFGSYLMVYLAIITGNADRASRGFVNYFLCESTGHVPGKCDRKEFERYTYPLLSVLQRISMAALPLSVLNFIVNWEAVWKSMKHLLGRTRTAIMSISSNNTEQTSISSSA